MTDQSGVFAAGEADRWFERNRARLATPASKSDPSLRLLELYGIRPRSVLEIGAANGYRLAAIADRTGSRVVAVEPSALAVADGHERFPAVEFHHGAAEVLPLSETFDLVIVNFVMHWIGRDLLLRVVSEIDRVVTDGGHLIIGDFDPPNQVKVPYHHLPGSDVFTFKQSYGELFVASGIYWRVAYLGGDARSYALSSDIPDEQRMGTWLLRKSLRDLYAPSVVPSTS